jgi:hypothetical protein
MPFEVKLSNDKSLVVYRHKLTGMSMENSVERIGLVGNFADQHGTSNILLDCREGDMPLHDGFYPALSSTPHFRKQRKWRIAVLASVGSPDYNISVTEGIVEMLRAKGQVAEHFLDYDKAVAWFVDA